MKLKNKKTGQLGNFIINKDHFECVDLDYVPEYRNLAELNEEWEDYEDDDLSKIIEWIDKGLEDEILPVSVNDLVEKLKAWKRLKDKGFKFDGYDSYFEGHWAIFPNDTEGTWCLAEDKADLDLLFSQEDD